MLLKCAAAFDWPGLAATTTLAKYGSRGLRGADRQQFIDVAGLEAGRLLQSLDLKPGEVPIHLIALGCTEKYGCNRNGDGFTKEACRRYHQTFQTHARWYRNHANTDPEQSYGVVKLAYFNEPMYRVELVVALNSDKRAADANRGLVADEELHKLAAGNDLPVSMSCKVPYDVCSGCGHRAARRAEYCQSPEEGGSCSRGGLKTCLTKVSEDGHVLFADNPTPLFFDISYVQRPADRTAYTTGLLSV